MRRIVELDGLRALAVASVIADHYAPFRTMGNGATASLGTFGVDLFFVLSGYLITTILLGLKTEHRPYQIFYARRLLRIVPPLALVLLLVYGAAAFLHQPISKPKLVGQLLFLRSFNGTGAIFSHIASILRGTAAVPGLFARVSGHAIAGDYPHLPLAASLGPTWSLSVEEWFYVFWAPTVLLLERRRILLVAIAICCMGFMLRWLNGNGSNFLLTVDVLVTGAILALWLEQRNSLPASAHQSRDRVVAVGSLVSFAGFLLLALLHRDRMACTLVEIAVAGGLAWIIVNTGSPQPLMAALRCKPLVYVGTISYMVYLVHLPMYFAVRSAFSRYLISWLAPTLSSWLVALASMFATVVFAALSWKFYETPILGLKSRLTTSLKRSRNEAADRRTIAAEVATGLR